MDKLERKLGKYAIPNLTLALIIGYALGYIIQFFDLRQGTAYLSLLALDPWKIIHGQVWRLVTWLIIPPNESNIIFVLLMMWCCLSIGMALEKTWGTFRYNVYIFGGILFTIIASFAALLYVYLSYYFQVRALGLDPAFASITLSENLKQNEGVWFAFSTYYINVSIYLGFAMTYPNNIVRFMFIIPMKMKWLGIVDILYMIYLMIFGGPITRFAVGAALLNILVFYLVNLKRFSFRAAARKAKFNQAYNAGAKRAQRGQFSGQWQNTAQYRQSAPQPGPAPAPDSNVKMKAAGAARHKCSICGQTELSNPNLEFRYCSKCVGNYEYCQEHLFTHTHKT